MIVDRFLVKLEPVVEEYQVNSLNGWMFERTHAKKDPTALKWKLSAPRSRKPLEKRVKLPPVIASRFTVKDLLHSDGLEVVTWEKMLLVSPRNLELPDSIAIDEISLKHIQVETEEILNKLRADRIKSKDALVAAFLLIEKLTHALKGRKINADSSRDTVASNSGSEKTGPVFSRAEKTTQS